jgi:hypothetical protein
MLMAVVKLDRTAQVERSPPIEQDPDIAAAVSKPPGFAGLLTLRKLWARRTHNVRSGPLFHLSMSSPTRDPR